MIKFLTIWWMQQKTIQIPIQTLNYLDAHAFWQQLILQVPTKLREYAEKDIN